MLSRNTEAENSLDDGDTRDVEMLDAPDRNGRQESSAGQVDGHSMSDVSSSPMDWAATLDGQDGQATGGYSEGDVYDASQMADRQTNAERLTTSRRCFVCWNTHLFLVICRKGPDASGPGPSDESAPDSDGDAEMS